MSKAFNLIFDLFYFSACGAQLDNFASKLENFQSLSNLATRQEIGRNLYLNYIFARYVTSETAEEQLWWLFDDLDGQKGRGEYSVRVQAQARRPSFSKSGLFRLSFT